jgi:hypothetical protein
LKDNALLDLTRVDSGSAMQCRCKLAFRQPDTFVASICWRRIGGHDVLVLDIEVVDTSIRGTLRTWTGCFISAILWFLAAVTIGFVLHFVQDIPTFALPLWNILWSPTTSSSSGAKTTMDLTSANIEPPLNEHPEMDGRFMEEPMLDEMERALAQSKNIARLTLLTFVFIPLSLTTSLFGMNFRGLQSFDDPSRSITWDWVIAMEVVTVAGLTCFLCLGGSRKSLLWFL